MLVNIPMDGYSLMLPISGSVPIAVDVPPYRLSGSVYGVLLNHPSLLAMLGDAANQPPYNSPPRAPVLYLKPRNTLAGTGDPVAVPAEVPELEAAASLGVVMERAACRLQEATALDYVAGFLIVNDVSIPHATYHRPSIRYKARDGFCPLGPAVVAKGRVASPDAIEIRTYVDGLLAQSLNTREMIRPIARLLEDVTEFMTLNAGDVLCVGTAAPAPRVRPGQSVAIEIDGIGTLSNPFVRGAP
jgi:5-oxopent-3-ene-1,2,5-tricarboxylate decarboxylase/2-hydroxyhepta-2,4-diene-1,7-dioate isomerase